MPGTVHLARRVFGIWSVSGYLGTAFGFGHPNLVLTALHVVDGQAPNQLRVVPLSAAGRELWRIADVWMYHRSADVAAFRLEPSDGWEREFFDLASPPRQGATRMPLESEALCYGFPDAGGEINPPPRLLKGHVQRIFNFRDESFDYPAYELSYLSFPGLSGAPVIDGRNRERVFGLVTRRQIVPGMNVPLWAIGVALLPYADWLQDCVKKVSGD